MKRTLILLTAVLLPLSAAAEQLYVQSANQKLLTAPHGASLATLSANTPAVMVEDKGDWVKVSIEGWVRRNTLTSRAAQVAAPSSGQPIELASYTVERKEEKGQKKVDLTLKVKNNTSSTVSSWRAIMTVQDRSTNQVLFSISVSHDDANIAPGKTGEVTYYFDWSEQQYDILLNNYPNNLKISLFRVEVSG